jgi:hypothetical protein
VIPKQAIALILDAKEIWPGLSNADLKLALWTLTTYPTGDPDEVLAALKDAYETSDGDLLRALHLADQQRTNAVSGK